jgi:hypothetical protein
MRIAVLFSLLLIFLQSCVEVKFAEPQPHGIKNIDVFPEAFQGQYLAGDKDTIEIFKEGFKFLNDSSLGKSQFVISDSFIIRQWKKTYFFNFKEKEDSVWTVFFLKTTKKNSSLGSLTFKEKESEKIDLIKNITEVKEIRNEDGNLDYLLIQPSRRELKKLLKAFPLYDFGTLQKIKK